MNCQKCNRSTSPVPGKSHFVCQTCQTFSFPTPIDAGPEPIVSTGREVEFQCPRCHVNLKVGTLMGKTDVCYCGSCRGFVIDNHSAGDLIEDLRASYTGPDAKPVMMNASQLEVRSHCPACGYATEAHPYHGPGNCVLDTCRHCKLVWFDHGELDVIVRAPGRRNVRR